VGLRAEASETRLARIPAEVADAVASNPLWYHTLELAPGLVTPGAFDLRPIVDRMPWPEVRGKRCLDVGTYDGFLAFELERRGAAEVLATDIEGHEGWDWPARMRASGLEYLVHVAGPDKGRGFQIARDALGSRVERVVLSVYELTPERLGTFDVVVCGSLMLHLRNPVRALEAIRSVCRGLFLSAEHVDLALSALHPRRPVARLGPEQLVHWWVPNVVGHRQMLVAAGFELVRATRPYAIPFGAGHPERSHGFGDLARTALTWGLTGGNGVPHAAALARPAS
jgi:tRNA (mo5U34)-methyltransferase